MTIATLIAHTVEAAEKAAGQEQAARATVTAG
jgi:hypothetical protein